MDKLDKAMPFDDKIAEIEDSSGLVDIRDIDDTIVLDIRYASDNNFVGKAVYPNDICLLQMETAVKIKKVNEIVKQDGFRVKIWDGYRPHDIQKVFWDIVGDPRYIADPSKGSNHNRGTAVDVTLVDEDGKEVKMPTVFDDFSEKAWRNYERNTPDAH